MRALQRRSDLQVLAEDRSARRQAQRALALARRWLSARFGPVEWVLLASLVVVPVAFMWHFASPSFFFWDDFANLYWAHDTPPLLSYLFGAIYGDHLSPAHRLAYLVLDRAAPLNFELALAFLLVCQATSAVLLQRILALLFGRALWTYVLALVWAVSVVHLSGLTWFAAGLHSIPAITATLASIHGYLCWRVTGRRPWLVWSLVAMCIGLAFYVKALLIPLYLLLMRALLLDPGARIHDSLRSVRAEWRVWLAYAAVCVAFVLAYLVGDYRQYYESEGGVGLGDALSYVRIFWLEGFSPLLFGIRVPIHDQGDLHLVAIVAAQAAVIALIAWSILRRRAAWRAWVFLLIGLLANGLILAGRVAQWGAADIAHTIRYYTEPALLVLLAVAFAFATPRLRGPARDLPAGERARPARLRLPTARVGTAVCLALVAYLCATWATASSLTGDASPDAEVRSGRVARAYLDNLRADLASARRQGVQPSLVDQDVPQSVVSQLNNPEPVAVQEGVRYTRLSSVVPLFDEGVSFNQPERLHIVRPDGHLERTHFIPAVGGSPAELRRRGRLRVHEARVERRGGEWCVVAEGLSALEWEPRPHLTGRDWWLRVRYRNDPVEPFSIQTNDGTGWSDAGSKLPPMGFPGTAIIDLSELPEGLPTNAGVRLGVLPFGRLCLRSLEIGYFDPAAPPPEPGPGPFE
jgi:hypothetical protein